MSEITVPANAVLHMSRAIHGVVDQLRPGEKLVVRIREGRADLDVVRNGNTVAGYGALHWDTDNTDQKD